MKTVEEAVEFIMPTGDGTVEQFAEITSRYASLIIQVTGTPNVSFVIGHLAKAVTRGEMSGEYAIATALINGLLIGIEIERADNLEVEERRSSWLTRLRSKWTSKTTAL